MPKRLAVKMGLPKMESMVDLKVGKPKMLSTGGDEDKFAFTLGGKVVVIQRGDESDTVWEERKAQARRIASVPNQIARLDDESPNAKMVEKMRGAGSPALPPVRDELPGQTVTMEQKLKEAAAQLARPVFAGLRGARDLAGSAIEATGMKKFVEDGMSGKSEQLQTVKNLVEQLELTRDASKSPEVRKQLTAEIQLLRQKLAQMRAE